MKENEFEILVRLLAYACDMNDTLLMKIVADEIEEFAGMAA